MEQNSNNIVRTQDVIGKTVLNNNDSTLGKIDEIVLDKVTGEARYFVLSFDTFMGFGGKLFAFPWKTISYDQNKEAFILNVDHDQLEESQGFDKDHWPDMADEAWQSGINQRFGVSYNNNNTSL